MAESKRGRVLSLVILILFLFTGDSFSAGEKNQSKILFLQIKIKDNSLILIKKDIRPGVLKQIPHSPDSDFLFYQVFSSSGALLWKGGIKDPSVVRYEYEDPDQPGKLKVKEIRLDEAEFTLRIPYNPEFQRIEFYKSVPSNDNKKQSVDRKSLGTIKLQPQK